MSVLAITSKIAFTPQGYEYRATIESANGVVVEYGPVLVPDEDVQALDHTIYDVFEMCEKEMLEQTRPKRSRATGGGS